MVVDDAPFMRHVVGKHLRAAGFEVVGDAPNAELALARYGLLRPHVVLLDLKLPGSDGLELLDSIREADPAARIVAVGTAADHARLSEAVRRGAVDYIQKPFQPDRVVAAVHRAVEHMPIAEPPSRVPSN